MESFLKEKKEIILSLLFCLAIFLILFHFTDTPKVWVDEGVFTEVAKNLAWHGNLGLQTDQGHYFRLNGFLLSTSYPVIFPIATSLYIFGNGVWQTRLPMVIYMFLFIVFSYLFVRRKYGMYPAVLSVLLLLSFSPFYGNGRPVQGEVPGLFFLILGLYFTLHFEESVFTSKKWAIWAGLAFGLSSATKPQYLTFISIALIGALILWFKKVKNKKILVYFFAGFILPIALWFYIHFPDLNSIKNLIPSYLYLAGNHESTLSTSQTIIVNFLRFFKESTPILFMLLSLSIVTAYIYRLKKEKWKSIDLSEFILLSFIFLNWVAYLKGTGWYRYFFPSHTMLYVLFPVSILAISHIIKNKFLKIIFLSLPILLIIFQFYHLVFLSDTSFVVSRTRNVELASVLGKIDSFKKVLFYNSVETIVFLKSDNYSQYLQMGDFLLAGDKDSILKPAYDYILTDQSQSGNLALSCYTEKPLSQYFFLERKPNCKDKSK